MNLHIQNLIANPRSQRCNQCSSLSFDIYRVLLKELPAISVTLLKVTQTLSYFFLIIVKEFTEIRFMRFDFIPVSRLNFMELQGRFQAALSSLLKTLNSRILPLLQICDNFLRQLDIFVNALGQRGQLQLDYKECCGRTHGGE